MGVTVLAPGCGEGIVIRLTAPLSFWGGTDAACRIIDRSHPQHGTCLAGSVLVLPCGRGSSSSSSVLAEALRRGVGPVAILLQRPDPIIAVAAIVAAELYGVRCPVAVRDGAWRDGERLRVEAGKDGALSVQRALHAVVMERQPSPPGPEVRR